MNYDIVIIGGGAAGLSFASALASADLSILVIEKSPLETIAKPKLDGREIALNHSSKQILHTLGVWDLLDQSQVSLLKKAKVFDGNSDSLLNFEAAANVEALGYLVPNQQIRTALFAKVEAAKNIKIMPDSEVENIHCFTDYSEVLLREKDPIHAKLVVAADSRFSRIRNKMGIPSLQKDFSKVMIVVKMQNEKPHQNIAIERFDYGRTLALLPMAGAATSLVITVSTDKADEILAMPEAEFNDHITKTFKAELGQMKQVGKRYDYPLVASHAATFIAKRFALIGDAAVATHPVTAHGFNLGLRGAAILATKIENALVRGEDIGSEKLLKSFENKHIHLTKLMFFGTNGIVRLFTNDAAILRPVRKLVLKFAEHFPPIKHLITRHLTNQKSRFLPF